MYSAAVRILVLWKTFILVSIVGAWAQSQHDGLIAVWFAIDGTPAHCDGFQVVLRLNGETINPKQTGERFEVPAAFRRPADKWKNDQRVDISLTCSGYTLVFPNQHPAFVREGDWRLGIAQPLYAVKEYGYTHEFDRGAWLGYLIFEGEPGVVTFSSQPDPPVGLSEALRKEQLTASPERLRDISYVLAVFNVEYQKNRDYLLSSLADCLSRPKESSEDEVCDRDLLGFLTNLYWRGDGELLAPLLQIAESRGDVIGGIGTFYADLLDRRGSAALDVMGRLPDDKQKLVCRLAADDSSINSSKRDRIIASLRKASGAPATRCLSAFGSN
jgi:hypothetical protein